LDKEHLPYTVPSEHFWAAKVDTPAPSMSEEVTMPLSNKIRVVENTIRYMNRPSKCIFSVILKWLVFISFSKDYSSAGGCAGGNADKGSIGGNFFLGFSHNKIITAPAPNSTMSRNTT